MAIAADLSHGLTEVVETDRWLRSEGCPFRFVEGGRHLLLRGPVNLGVGCATLPLLERLVLGVEAGERPPLEGVLLDGIDAPLGESKPATCGPGAAPKPATPTSDPAGC